MPLVLATDAPTASGHLYDDVLGLRYEFPARYRGLVNRGEPFVYYKGSRGAENGRPVYFGAGVVGSIRASKQQEHLVADVSDVEFFERPVPAKEADGTYIETGSTKRTNWPNGVRRISDRTLAHIIQLASAGVADRALPDGSNRSHFASPEHAGRLERYSVAVAMGLLTVEYGPECVTEMPPGNPGFDIRVARGAHDLHVEVKGTVLHDPVFHLSEGQRHHAEARGDNFRLIVVYRVDLDARTHLVATVDGPLDSTKVELNPEAWAGRVLPHRLAPEPVGWSG